MSLCTLRAQNHLKRSNGLVIGTSLQPLRTFSVLKPPYGKSSSPFAKGQLFLMPYKVAKDPGEKPKGRILILFSTKGYPYNLKDPKHLYI
nr:hypothetical protein CFP56_75051 [Quercus suber]POE79298.1 hypothetical protein CFP56_15239 [Quercus suber]